MESKNPKISQIPTSDDFDLHAIEIEAMASHFYNGSALQSMQHIAAGWRRLAENTRRLEANELELMRGWRPWK